MQKMLKKNLNVQSLWFAKNKKKKTAKRANYQNLAFSSIQVQAIKEKVTCTRRDWHKGKHLCQCFWNAFPLEQDIYVWGMEVNCIILIEIITYYQLK